MAINKVEFDGNTLIDLTSDTVTASDVLTGKTFHLADGSIGTGTMTNNGSVTVTIATGDTYTIPQGYHDGTGTVTATETRTSLWSTTATSSGAFTCTLSQPATNFKRIRIEYTTFQNANVTAAVEINMDDKEWYTGNTTNYGRIALGTKGSSYWYTRFGYFRDDTDTPYTAIYWTTCYRANAANTQTAYCLPTHIYGIN